MQLIFFLSGHTIESIMIVSLLQTCALILQITIIYFQRPDYYVNSPLVGGAFSFFVCLYYIVGIRRFKF